jgi:hypothetical protein
MRLNKTAFLFKVENVLVGTDPDTGQPICEVSSVPSGSFNMEFEPYGTPLPKAQNAINVVDVKYLMYTNPDDRLKVNTEFVYNKNKYKIISLMKYDRHYEIFINDLGTYLP